MKRKLIFTLGLTGVLTLTFGFAKDLQSIKVSAEEKTDITTIITKEEQNTVENLSAKKGFVTQENGTGFFFVKGEPTESKDTTVITAEEQKMVEKMSVKEGFVTQENGTGFFFIKEK